MKISAIDQPVQRMAVIGAGAMGISLAATLAQSVPVVLVVRRRSVAARIASEGIRVTGLGDAYARPIVVPDIESLTSQAPLDAIFVATKTTAIDDVASRLQPIITALGANRPPFVVSFQNGIESGHELSERMGHDRVLRMVLNYGARLSSETEAEVTLSHPPHAIGGPDGRFFEMASHLAHLLTLGGMESEPVENIEPFVWKKGIVNASMNPVAALMNASVGEVLDSPARSVVANLLAEGIGVADREGIPLGVDAEQKFWDMLEAARPHTPSMVEDIRAGRLTEVGQLNRQVIAHALRLGISVPCHETVSALIEAFDWRVFRASRGSAQSLQH